MNKRSRSTIDRDHSRARNHQAYNLLQDYRSIDWLSVNEEIIPGCIVDLEELLNEIEDESLEFQLQELVDSLREL